MIGLQGKKELRLAITFGVVGVINTAVDVGIFSFLLYVADMHLIIANSVGYIVAATNSFFMNKYWTFSETGRHSNLSNQYMIFIALGLVGLGISNLVVFFLSGIMIEIVAKLLSVLVGFIWNFSTSRLFVFK